ncbi:MAG: BON domain-containing protein [Tatlockia sp.]|nr:BON domain-containing protein [Tatlockia sp.]
MLTRIILCGTLAFVSINSLPAYAGINTPIVKQSIKDSNITKTIEALYSKSPALQKQSISVITVEQQVVLAGTLNSNQQYERALTLASSVLGVNAINADNLRVRSSKAPLKDTYITAKVKGSFIKEKIFGSKNIELWPITVETKNSTVHLAGEVKNLSQRANLIKIAQAVEGVKKVESDLRIRLS